MKPVVDVSFPAQNVDLRNVVRNAGITYFYSLFYFWYEEISRLPSEGLKFKFREGGIR